MDVRSYLIRDQAAGVFDVQVGEEAMDVGADLLTGLGRAEHPDDGDRRSEVGGDMIEGCDLWFELGRP